MYIVDVLVKHAGSIKRARGASGIGEHLRDAEAQVAHRRVVGLRGLLERWESGFVREQVGPVQRELHLVAAQVHVAADIVPFLRVAYYKKT